MFNRSKSQWKFLTWDTERYYGGGSATYVTVIDQFGKTKRHKVASTVLDRDELKMVIERRGW